MTSSVRVLVVDDEPSIRDSLAMFLEDFNYQVSVAGSAEAALKLFETDLFDISVVDLRLPGMSGETFIQQVHEISPDTRFLIHTGSIGYRLPDELRRIGLRQEDVFLKPLLDMTPIADSIMEMISRGQA